MIESSFRALNPSDLARIEYSIALIANEMPALTYIISKVFFAFCFAFLTYTFGGLVLYFFPGLANPRMELSSRPTFTNRISLSSRARTAKTPQLDPSVEVRPTPDDDEKTRSSDEAPQLDSSVEVRPVNSGNSSAFEPSKMVSMDF